MLVTVVRYRAITGDQTSTDAAVSARIEEAVEALEDILDRPLAHAERTERMYPTRDGRLWPRAVPLTDGGDYTIDGTSLSSGGPWPAGWGVDGCPEYVEVTYSGGFVERTANPDATNRLPECIERDLAWAANRLLATPRPTVQVPAGATSISVGDVSVSFGPGGAPAGTDALSGVWSKRTLTWRHHVVRSDR